MLLFDTHVHTESSDDAEHSVTYIAEKAEERGLAGITITDHCEIEHFKDLHYYRKITQSMMHALIAKGVFKDRMKVLVGVEIGQSLVNPAYVDQVLRLGKFDYVLGSLHGVNGGTDFYYMRFDEEEYDIPALLDGYYDEMCRMLEWGFFDTLAHITYPFRYIHGEYHLPFVPQMYEKEIDQVMRLCIEKGIALEINTSGLRQPIGETLPNLEILKRYRAMGGKLITLGSDSHSAFQVGMGIKEGLEVAKAAGFNEYYYFEDRQPVAVPIL